MTDKLALPQREDQLATARLNESRASELARHEMEAKLRGSQQQMQAGFTARAATRSDTKNFR